jgi:FxsC-like protein
MYFFFSYSRQNNDDFLRDFYTELNKSIRDLVGLREDAGFFDQTGLEPGDFWEKRLEGALSTSRVFVAAVTAGYAKSDYCGREWAAFESRVDAYTRKLGNETPALIIPILWIPPAGRLPKEITERQYKFGNPDDDHNKNGLVRFYKLKPKYEDQRVSYVDALAQYIIKLYDAHASFDECASVPELAKTPSGFSLNGTPAAQGTAAAKGPQRVHFVFGAASSADVKRAGRKNVDPYGGGGEEWQPYFPSARKIGSIARQTAALDELNLWPDPMTVSADLPTRIRQAESLRELVVMFVDGWTAGLPEYQSALKAFDQQNYVNCSVIVPLNAEDPENQSNNQKLQETLKDALKFRFSGQNDLYYRAAINTEDDLRRQLVEVLTRLRAEVINKSTPDRGVIPDSSGSRPVISGPGK